jgi:hypothetical protein
MYLLGHKPPNSIRVLGDAILVLNEFNIVVNRVSYVSIRLYGGYVLRIFGSKLEGTVEVRV